MKGYFIPKPDPTTRTLFVLEILTVLCQNDPRETSSATYLLCSFFKVCFMLLYAYILINKKYHRRNMYTPNMNINISVQGTQPEGTSQTPYLTMAPQYAVPHPNTALPVTYSTFPPQPQVLFQSLPNTIPYVYTDAQSQFVTPYVMPTIPESAHGLVPGAKRCMTEEAVHEQNTLLPRKRTKITRSQNRSVTSKHESSTETDVKPAKTSEYRGVCWHRKSRVWKASITYKGKKTYLGCYDDEIEAARAYDKEAIRLKGPTAFVNISDGSPGQSGTLDANETSRHFRKTKRPTSAYQGVC